MLGWRGRKGEWVSGRRDNGMPDAGWWIIWRFQVSGFRFQERIKGKGQDFDCGPPWCDRFDDEPTNQEAKYDRGCKNRHIKYGLGQGLGISDFGFKEGN